jgi:hypothetical protein
MGDSRVRLVQSFCGWGSTSGACGDFPFPTVNEMSLTGGTQNPTKTCASGVRRQFDGDEDGSSRLLP